tara:strand:- start:89 stop:328 length:240 start_codon:yes stop_codon:yes gene_type:complete
MIEYKLTETVDELVDFGHSGKFNLKEIMQNTILADANGDLATILTTFILSAGDSSELLGHLICKIQEEVKEEISEASDT